MLVPCVLCGKKDKIDAHSVTGKRLLNHPLKTYMCTECEERITLKTEKRRAEGTLRPRLFYEEKNDW